MTRLLIWTGITAYLIMCLLAMSACSLRPTQPDMRQCREVCSIQGVQTTEQEIAGDASKTKCSCR